MKRTIALFLLLALVLAMCTGCYNERDIDKAEEAAYEQGYREGQRDGRDEGYHDGYYDGYSDGYFWGWDDRNSHREYDPRI